MLKKVVNDKEYWKDENNNLWSCDKYTELQAIQGSQSLIKSYNCIDCLHCTYCNDCIDCKDCDVCTECVSCEDCTNCRFCKYCEECEECLYCKGCKEVIDGAFFGELIQVESSTQ